MFPVKKSPNILVILCDDLGYGDVQCLNPERGKIATPQMDKLAAEGVITYETNGQVAEVSSSGVGCELGVRRIEGLREWLGAAMHRSVQLLLLLRRKEAGWAADCLTD